MSRHELIIGGTVLGVVVVGACLLGLAVAINGPEFLQKDSASRLMPVRHNFPARESESLTPRNLDSFEKADATWKEQYAQNIVPPLGKFQAYYFNTDRPEMVVHSQLVDSVDLNFAWDEGPGFTIASENLGAYWIGQVTYTEAQNIELAVSQSWSEARVIIDGRVVYESERDSGWVALIMPAGSHVVEVEYANNWHTTSFSVSLLPMREYVSEVALQEALQALSFDAAWYAGVYESSAADHSVMLSAPHASPTPKVLFLSSYDSVKWDLPSMPDLALRAIVVGSYSPGSSVLNAPADVPVYYLADGVFPAAYELDLYEFGQARNFINTVAGVDVSGFIGAYATGGLVLPGDVLTPELIDERMRVPSAVTR